MSYQVLARKWRPRHFSELVGQQHVKTALANALTSSRLHHAYLFTGTRGVVKTTIARIFAKSLNCETGITATPCGQCSACQEIDAGNFVDLLEIDAASRTKVEDTRDLLDNVQYAPSRGRFKVYLIDEVHMLSRHSFNALLKTLEEPPPHVKFLLATTDPQKLPITVLSRCLQFSLKALTPVQIEQHLAEVLAAEQIPFEAAALTALAKAAKGSLRDSLSLTDQAIALSNSNLTVETVRQMLGLLDTRFAVSLLSALLAADMPQLQQALQELLSQQSDYQQVLDDMLSLLHLTALTQLQPAAADLSEQAEMIRYWAAHLAPEAVQLYYQLLISGKKELPFAPEPVVGLEMALLRAMAFVPASRTEPQSSAPTQALSTPAASTPQARPAVMAAPIAPHAMAPVTAPSQVTSAAAEPHQPTEAAAIASATTATLSASATMPNTALGNNPITTPDKHSATPVASAIDEGTARIMARRGVQVTAAPPAVETVAGKKPERPMALPQSELPRRLNTPPSAMAATTKPQQATAVVPEPAAKLDPRSHQHDDEDSATADDTVSFAEQQALTEAWWQQQQFDVLPSNDTDELDEQRFSIRFAAQVDAWSRLIEQLSIGGLLRLYLLHSAMQQNGLQVQLQVAQSQQHLDKGDFREKLYAAISPVFPANFQLEIQYLAEINASPLAIQQRIEHERKDYVSRLLQQDPKLQAIQQIFSAELQLDTLQVN
ncbi:MAG: DNA polymerase III subunit gamma/tau [Alishewanella sp.]|nr:DNA polymerase III subunit gamma/tau [Alishewanella sp.]